MALQDAYTKLHASISLALPQAGTVHQHPEGRASPEAMHTMHTS